jgi:hypothetical protein
MFPLLVSLLIPLLPSVESATDSVPLHQARQNLEDGDTLGAIDILDEWSSHHEVGRELSDLLGRLHLPDEPVDTLMVADERQPVKVQSRKWRLRVDGGGLVADPWCWDLGATLATQLAVAKLAGAPAFLEGGMVSVVWSTRTETPLWALEPLVSLTVQAGSWDFRVQGWSGVFDEELDAGLLATGSIARGDSGAVHRRWGGALRWSLASTSMAGVFGQWDDAVGDWTWNARTDLRLRYDPVEGAVSSDSLLLVRAARLQAISRAMVLRHFGKWGFGPALELDLRTSLASDRWNDSGTTYRKEIRRDLSFSAGAVARYAVRNGQWIELRLGWSGAAMNSEIDPSYSDRNTGFMTSFASGLSF